MRKTLAGLLLAALGGAAGAQEATLEGVARSASLMRQIADACPAVMEVDRDLAERYVAAFKESGEAAFGGEAFGKALDAEYARRAAEVKKKGAESWCRDQRARLRDMGESGAALFRK